MRRILEPGQIEAFAQRDIPRLRLPERTRVFSARAERLRGLGARGAIGESIGDYLHLIACIAEAQQRALTSSKARPPTPEQIAQARTFRMPLLQASSWAREDSWRHALAHLCDSVSALADVPASVRQACDRLLQMPREHLEARADALLGSRTEDIDVVTAPFIMAALQVHWVDLATTVAVEDVADLDVRGVCPLCGTSPVASIVRAEAPYHGLRYLHCALCSTEWHLVRVTCSHCMSTKGISYQSIEGAGESVRAECCDSCRTYRKIVYQEKDSLVEPVADDLASLQLDVLLGEAGYQRANGNPMLWQR